MLRTKPDCEAISKVFLPVLRARVAQRLSRDYDMQQYEIAEMLGVTQAAVSFYLGKERGSSPSLIRKFPEIDKTAKKMAYALNNGAKEDDLSELFCEFCRKVRKKRVFKQMYR